MITQFEIICNNNEEERHITPPPDIPDCDMAKLVPGDMITLKRSAVKCTYPVSCSSVESWTLEVTSVSFAIHYWKDPDKDTEYYEPETVSARQIVTVIVRDHTY